MFIETTQHKELTCNVGGKVHEVTFDDGLAEVDEEVGQFLINVGAVERSQYQGESDPGKSDADKQPLPKTAKEPKGGDK